MNDLLGLIEEMCVLVRQTIYSNCVIVIQYAYISSALILMQVMPLFSKVEFRESFRLSIYRVFTLVLDYQLHLIPFFSFSMKDTVYFSRENMGKKRDRE